MRARKDTLRARQTMTKRMLAQFTPSLRTTRTARDVVVLAMLTVLAVLAEIRFDLLERFPNRNSKPVNEMFELTLILALLFASFAWRRWSDLRLANRRQIAVERQLQASAVQYQLLFDANPQAMLVCDEEMLAFLGVNNAAITQYGYTRDEFLAMTINDLCLPAEAAELQEYLARQSTEFRHGEVWPHRKKDGTPINVEVTAHHVIFAGRPARLILAVDVTEQVSGEAALRESEARKGAILEAALDCIISIDHTGAIIEFNPAAERTFGHRRADVIGKPMAEIIIPPALRAEHHDGFARYLATGIGTALDTRLELPAIRADGSEFPVELTINRVPIAGPPTFTAFLRDITERTRIEGAVAASERRFQAMVERSADGIVLINAAHQRTYVSPATASVLGYTPEEYRQLPGETLFHPGGAQRMSAVLHDLLDKPGESTTVEIEVRHKDGTWRWLAISYTNLLGEPDVQAIVANFHDVTERKSAEEALRESEERYRRLVDYSPDAIAVHSDSRYVYVNDAAVRLFGGQQPADVLGHSIYDFLPEGQQETLKQTIHTAARADTPPLIESKRQRLDGAVRDVESIGIPITYQGKPAAQVIYRDVTERKEEEVTLRRQNTYLSALHETSLGLLNHLDLTELLEAILTRAGDLLGAPDGLIFWLEQSDTEMPTRIGIGTFREDTRPPVQRGEGLMGAVWETGERLVINDYQQWPQRRTGDIRNQIHAAVAVPLLADGQVIGVISLVHMQPARVFSNDEVELLTRFAHLAAIALHNARLYTQVREELRERERAEAQLRESEERYRTLIERSPEPILVHAREQYVFANAAALRLLGAAQSEDVIGQMVSTFIHPTFRALARRRIRKSYIEGQSSGVTELTMLRVDGESFEVETDNMPITFHDGPATLVIFRDITTRKQAERQVRDSEERYRLLFDSNPLPMWVYDRETLHFLAVNDAAIGHYGYSRAEFLSMATPDIRPPEEIPALRLFLATHTEKYQPSGIWRHRKKDGALVEMEITSYALAFEGRPARLVVANDVTERQRAEEALRHHALHDALTGLPNRTLFAERLARALERAKRDPAYSFAVLYLDFDRFKTINDSLGHLEGDQTLIEGAHRLSRCMRPQDTLSRFGGDEFVLLLEELIGPDDPAQIACCLNEALAQPIMLHGQEVVIAASIGIVHCAAHYHRPDEVLRDADIAMYQAKARGDGVAVVFDTTMHARAVARMFLETDLRRALEQAEFTLFYQPIVALATGEITGFETLLRWQHPEIGLIAPDAFIPLAEEMGLIVPLGRWVLREACRQLREWDDKIPGHMPISISINVSARELRQADFVASIIDVLSETGLEPRRLIVEITESTLVEETEAVTGRLHALHDFGVAIHLDDFGMGYSSLSYLHRFPIDALKIDRSFVSAATHGGIVNRGIIAAIVALAHTLQIAVTAEGIETAAQQAELEALQCEYGQGYRFSPPIAATDVMDLLANENVLGRSGEHTSAPAIRGLR